MIMTVKIMIVMTTTTKKYIDEDFFYSSKKLYICLLYSLLYPSFKHAMVNLLLI